MIQNLLSKMKFLWHSKENIQISSEHLLSNDTLLQEIDENMVRSSDSLLFELISLLYTAFAIVLLLLLSSVKVP